ncbi:hypothetical protein RCL_jg23782.t1 [Rhizophagus clarus]|uniref:Uncharacterized protein n=1 Tax=Rhizophagus clarus TaxID=94130 RepID=A0A8H3LQG4_9GLOM|nr:hypothetical protein RCL_jg23782.t1 [Rhizophagus clarus]
MRWYNFSLSRSMYPSELKIKDPQIPGRALWLIWIWIDIGATPPREAFNIHRILCENNQWLFVDSMCWYGFKNIVVCMLCSYEILASLGQVFLLKIGSQIVDHSFGVFLYSVDLIKVRYSSFKQANG